MEHVKVAGLTSENEFESQKVKDHIKNLAASAVDVSGLARREDVDSITQKIESGELKGDPGEVVGVFGETDAAFADGTLTIDPNYAVVKVPQISGAVTVKIEDVDLPRGVESANGVQVTLLMEGVDEDADISWPVGTITHDKSVPDKHVALLLRTKNNWEVFFPPVSSSSVDVNTSTSLFSEEYPALHEKVYDSQLKSMVDGRIIPIQEQISGSVHDLEDREIEYGKITDDRGSRTTISDVFRRLWGMVTTQSESLSKLGKTVTDVEYREYDEEEKFISPDPSDIKYGSFKSTFRPATTVKEIDDVPHLVHWMPRWSENMSKVLSGEMSYEDFYNQFAEHEKPQPPQPTYEPVPGDPYSFITVPPSEEEMDAYREDLRIWSNAWEVSPISWEAYTVPMTRNESLDEEPWGTGFDDPNGIDTVG